MKAVISKISVAALMGAVLLAGAQACGGGGDDDESTRIEPARTSPPGGGDAGARPPTATPTATPPGGLPTVPPPGVEPTIVPPPVEPTVVPPPPPPPSEPTPGPTDAEATTRALSILTAGDSCASCHAFTRGNAGIALPKIKERKAKIVERLELAPGTPESMPPQEAGIRQLNDDERTFLILWLKTSPALQ